MDYTDAQTTTISLEPNSKIDYFPTNFFKIFPNLQTLVVNGNDIKNFVTNTFNYCNKLNTVIVTSYKFTFLPAAFAQNCKNLESLTFHVGELTTLDPNALKGLSSLRFFLAVFSKISCLPSNFFIHTPNIEQIALSRNKLISLDPITFRNLPKIFSLDFEQNDITIFPNFDLSNTGTMSTSNRLYINFNLNSFKAINPNFITTIFNARQSSLTFIYFSADPSSVNFLHTCLPKSTVYFEKGNFTAANTTLKNCYNNWQPSMKNYKNPCDSSKTTKKPKEKKCFDD